MRVHRGVFTDAPGLDIPLGPEVAALLAVRHHPHLAHHSAATLYGMRPGTARPVNVVIAASRRAPKLHGVVVNRSRILSADDVTVHRGLPVTTPPRTILDVAYRLGDRGTELIVREAFALHLCDDQDLTRQAERSRGHVGRATLLRVLDRGEMHGTDTDDEEKMYQLILDAQLPKPQTQVWILDYRLDFYWPKLLLGVELDAYGTHGGPGRWDADTQRDNRLFTETGITMIRITRPQIRNYPLAALATVAQAITRAAAASSR